MNSGRLYILVKTIAVLAGCTVGLFIALGLGTELQSRMSTSPLSSMKGLASSVSSSFFMDMISMELPQTQVEKETYTFSGENMAKFLFRFVTGIHPQDPKSLLALEVPGLSNERAVLLRSGKATNDTVYPIDYTPSDQLLQPHQIDGSDQANGGFINGDVTDELEERGRATTGQDEMDGSSAGGKANIGASTEGTSLSSPLQKKVLIYHTHNRESWVPELENVKKFSEAFHPEINITLLGKYMAEKLETLGIGAINSEVDYPTAVKDYNYNFSYKYSLETIKEAMATSGGQLQYFFDIHRDAQKRDLTTVNIDGLEYAQVYFIVGHRNPGWHQNEQFASSIHERMEELYPGISRGVWGKSANTGHAEYNQSVSPNSILIEVGGPENTLEESYRTIDVLVEVIAEYIHEAEKVDAPVQSK